MKPIGLRMMESLVQGKLARRVRWGGCGNVHLERDATRRVLTLSLQERRDAWNVCKHHPNYYDGQWRKEFAGAKTGKSQAIPGFRVATAMTLSLTLMGQAGSSMGNS